MERERGRGRQNVHGHVDVLHGHLAVDGLHGRAGVLHSGKGFLVDVCGFDRVYLLFEHGYLAVCLLERVFVLLLPFERGASGCDGDMSAKALTRILSKYFRKFLLASTACV